MLQQAAQGDGHLQHKGSFGHHDTREPSHLPLRPISHWITDSRALRLPSRIAPHHL